MKTLLCLFLVACSGSVVEIPPAPPELADSGFSTQLPSPPDAAKQLPDAMIPICPVLNGYCEGDQEWCSASSPARYWSCVNNHWTLNLCGDGGGICTDGKCTGDFC